MRILFVLHQFYPEFSSGTERVTLNLARAAQRAGHYVHVLACAVDSGKNHGSDAAYLVGAKATVYAGVPVTLIPRDLLPVTSDYSLEVSTELVQPIAEWMKQAKFDLAHVMHTMRMSTAVLAAQQCGLPYLLTLTDFFLECARINLVTLDNRLCTGPDQARKCGKDCLTAPWDGDSLAERYQAGREILSGAGARVAPSGFVAARYHQAFPDIDFRVIPHGIDLLKLMGKEEISLGSASLEKKPITFGYVGSIIAQKGLDVLLRGFAKIKAPHIRLKIIGGFYGGSAYQTKVQALAQVDPRVEFLGHMHEAGVFATLPQFDVLCVPSQVPETFSLSLHEAAALGVPALVSNLGAPGEYVSANGCGQTVSAGDAGAWAEAIESVVKTPGLVQQWKNLLPLAVRVEEEAFFYDSFYRTLLHSS